MSVVASERTESSTEFFDVAITLRAKITQILKEDFGDDKRLLELPDGSVVENRDYWLYKEIRQRIFGYAADLIANITAANTIYITTQNEYGTRRKYMTAAISNCQQIIQEFTYAVKVLPIPSGKYLQYVDQLNAEAEYIKKWRKSDNKVLRRILKDKEVRDLLS